MTIILYTLAHTISVAKYEKSNTKKNHPLNGCALVGAAVCTIVKFPLRKSWIEWWFNTVAYEQYAFPLQFLLSSIHIVRYSVVLWGHLCQCCACLIASLPGRMSMCVCNMKLVNICLSGKYFIHCSLFILYIWYVCMCYYYYYYYYRWSLSVSRVVGWSQCIHWIQHSTHTNMLYAM